MRTKEEIVTDLQDANKYHIKHSPLQQRDGMVLNQILMRILEVMIDIRDELNDANKPQVDYSVNSKNDWPDTFSNSPDAPF